MNASNLHLNLLRDAEKVSSSPVRLRVMLPVITLFACIGLTLWWAIILSLILAIM